MTKILDQAIDAVRSMSPDEQDEIARAIRFQTLESKGFKPVPGGFVFRVPNPWVFGRANDYLVTDAQLEEIEAMPGPILSDIALAVLASAIVSVILFSAWAWLPADFLGGQTVGRYLLAFGQGGIPVLIGLQCLRCLAFRRLRPILVCLLRTKE
jgi:hypothetical protein